MDEIIEKRISFNEAECESKKCKNLATVKESFLKQVGLTSWEEAKEVIDKIGGEEKLLSFEIKQGKPLPKNFEVSNT